MKKIARVFTYSLLNVFLFIGCQKETKSTSIELSNPTSVKLTDKAISIDRSQLKENIDEGLAPYVTASNGDNIPVQLDDLDGDTIWDALFFVADIPPNGKSMFTLEWKKGLQEFTAKTSVRFGKRLSADIPVKPALKEVMLANELPKSIGFQRYQTDGPSWENDKVGFRHYLDGRNAKDLFAKKTAAITPEDVGLDENGATVDNYHVMESWGRDVLWVGNSLGIGGYGLSDGTHLLRLGVTVEDAINNVEKTTFQIITEGPVRSQLKYIYDNWRPENTSNNYSVEETTTIWPGMYGYQNSVRFNGLVGNETMIVGLANSNTEQELTVLEENEKFVVLYTHDKQTYEKVWTLGLALIVPKEVYLGSFEAPKEGRISNTFLAKIKVENNKAFQYYALACWELSDKGFVNKDYFVNYLNDITNQLAVEVIIRISE